MKIFLTAILIITIFTTYAIYVSASPPSRIIIRSEEELLELRIIVEANDEELAEFLEGYFSRNGIETREDLISFLKLLDSLPIPHEGGMYFSGLTYYPFSSSQTIDISFRGENREIRTFRLYAGGDMGRNIIENSLNGEPLVEISKSQDGKIIIYSPPKAWNSFPNEHGIYFLPIEINGYFMSSIYNPGNISVTDVTPEKIFEGLTVVSFRDITWLDRNQPGDIFGEGWVTTVNALEILRFVAGLEHDIRSQSAMAAADVNGDGKIDTADALEMLRIVAGL
jgi:hypothetical protein